MLSTEKSIMNKLYFVSGVMFVFALLVVYKLITIQFVQGAEYRGLAEQRRLKMLRFLPIAEMCIL